MLQISVFSKVIRNAFLAGVISLLFSGCANSSGTSFPVVRTTPQPHKVFVFAQIGGAKHGVYPDDVVNTLTQKLRKCGFDVKADNLPASEEGLALTDNPQQSVLDQIARFNPDHVLYVKDNVSAVQSGAIDLTAQAKFKTYPEEALIWYGSFKVSGFLCFDCGGALSAEIVDKMKEDKMLGSSCR